MGSIQSRPITDKITITSLNLPAYMGEWWEVARYDNMIFEKGCDRAKAEYSLQTDGAVKVVNTCYRNGLATRSDQGRAQISDERHPGILSLQFERPSYLPPSAQWPKFSAPYIIHFTDYKNYAIVGGIGPSGSYLWILSRRRQIRPQDFSYLMGLVTMIGYDISPLIFDPATISKKAAPPVDSIPAEPWVWTDRIHSGNQYT